MTPPDPLLVNTSLFIDFDGTLVELVDRPDAVRVDDGLRSLLRRLGSVLPGRVALVSGRSIAQLDAMLGPPFQGMAYAGSHGSERRWRDGRVEQPEPAPELPAITSALQDFASAHPGIIVEPKTLGVALHYRLAPSVGAQAHAIVTAFARDHGLAVQTGKMMVELKAAHGDKGSAVRAAFAAQPEMAGTFPIFIGDDLTDEAGFEAAGALGGTGVLVGETRETAAHYRLADVQAVRAWLKQLIECTG